MRGEGGGFEEVTRMGEIATIPLPLSLDTREEEGRGCFNLREKVVSRGFP